jgi:hypothetical protein
LFQHTLVMKPSYFMIHFFYDDFFKAIANHPYSQ